MHDLIVLGPFYLAATVLVSLGVAAYLLRSVLSLLTTGRTDDSPIRKLLDRTATLLLTGAILAIGFFLALRWMDTGKPPFQTQFETYLVLAFCIGLTFIVMERFYRLPMLGLLSTLGMLLLLLKGIGNRDAEIARLPAALQSVWFVPHVLVYFVGYASLAVAAGAGLLYLIRPSSGVSLSRGDEQFRFDMVEIAEKLIRFGFVFLTLGLLMGAFWAKAAWGDYWTWDPKENWSLVTWLLYLIYFHLSYSSWWNKRWGAVLAIAGFAAVMFTYLGMKMLPDDPRSLHLYK